MLFDTKKLQLAFEMARKIKEHKDLYCLDPKRIPVSIEDLQYVLTDMTGIKIEKFEVLMSGEIVHLRGLIEKYEGYARILVRSNQPEPWQRFTAAKELCHLAVDEIEDFSVDGHGTIKEMVEQHGQIIENKQLPNRHVQSEHLAEIIAIELLYPFEFREEDIRQIKESKGKVTTASLALHYKVPEFMINRALASPYMTSVKKWIKKT